MNDLKEDCQEVKGGGRERGESEWGEREGERRRGGERVRERCCDAATSDW